MIRFMLCDDDSAFLDSFAQKVREISADLKLEVELCSFTSSEKLTNAVLHAPKEGPSVYFLDIDMPGLSGFELAETIRAHIRDACIVFVSQKNELVFQSLEYHPFFFLRKDHLDQELGPQLRAIRELFCPEVHMVSAKCADLPVEFPIESVYVIEADRNYILFHQEQDDPHRPIRLRMSIAKAYELWKPCGFLWVHRGFLVNIRYIARVTRKTLTMKNGLQVRVGRSRIDMIRQAVAGETRYE